MEISASGWFYQDSLCIPFKILKIGASGGFCLGFPLCFLHKTSKSAPPAVSHYGYVMIYGYI